MPYHLDGNCVKKDSGETVKCHDTHEQAVAHLRALYANVEDAKTKSLTNTIRQILEAKIHDSFTRAADELAMRGYVNRDERIALSGNIGDVLGKFGESIAQAVADKMVSPSDVDCIAAKEVSADASPNALHGPNSLLGIEGVRGRKREKKDAKAEEDLPDDLKTRTKGYDEHGSLTVIADAKGNPRWILRSSSGFRDRDGELITTKALADDCERMNATGKFGPLRWWHVGSKSDTPERGLDIGDCDLSMMSGHTRVESGTFRHPVFARAVKEHVAKLGGSLGFRYPATQPDATKTITHVRTFERSVLPKENVSNLMALKQRLFGKQEDAMDEAQQIAKLKELVGAENHALVDSFLASAKKDEGTLAAMNVDVKAKKDEPETPAEEAKETPMDEKKEDAMDAKKTKEIDADAIADAIMTKMASAFLTPAQLDAKLAELTTVATKSADEQKVALKEYGDKLAALDTRIKTLEGDTPTSKMGYKASEAAGTSILKSMFSQLADQQGLDLAALGVKSATRSQTEMERIAERMASEWKQNGTAPVA